MEKRQQYINNIPAIEDSELEQSVIDYVKSIIDDCEAFAANIRDLLDISDVTELNSVIEAYEICKDVADKLY